MRARAVLLGLLLGACGAAQTAQTPRDRADHAPRTPADDVLDLHARAFGGAAEVARALPVSLRGKVTNGGPTDQVEIVMDAKRMRASIAYGGLRTARGIDARGPWALDVPGVPARLEPEEAGDARFEEWLARRRYLTDRPDAWSRGPGQMTLSFASRADLGAPELIFDPSTGALLAARHTSLDGIAHDKRFTKWTEADGGVRWPEEWETETAGVGRTQIQLVARTRKLECSTFGPPATGDACLSMPPPVFEIGGFEDHAVTYPVELELRAVLFRATAGERTFWAMLDSGAQTSVIDAASPLAVTFRPHTQLSFTGATQALGPLGIGELSDLRAGDLTMRHLPAAKVPAQVLSSYGLERPEVLVGAGMFLAAAVRIDFAKSELVVAKDARALVGPNATGVHLRMLEGRLFADADVEGRTASLEVDTGARGLVMLERGWAQKNGLLEGRKTASVEARYGAGEKRTVATLLRLGHARVGPLDLSDALTTVDARPNAGSVAGRLGLVALAQCQAAVFDVAHRTLWLETPCSREIPTQRSGWLLENDGSAQPWLVAAIAPGGAADEAGLRGGDRLTSIGGVAITADAHPIERAMSQPAGTRVPVTVKREGRPVDVVLTLRDLLR